MTGWWGTQHAGWIWPPGHSAPRLSSVLRTPPLCRCAERPSNQILHVLVIAPVFVIADLIRNPVVVWHWIPDVETPDLIRGRDDKLDVRDDNTKGGGHSRSHPLRRLRPTQA